MPPAYRNNPRRVDSLRTKLLAALACALATMSANGQARAAPCSFETQGEGRVAAVIDARSFRLEDGREIRLAGIEPISADAAKRTAALSAIFAGPDVPLPAARGAPDRDGRQRGVVFV